MLTYSFENIDTESMYEHLYRCIKQDILQKKLRAGEKLPSKRTFAKNLGGKDFSCPKERRSRETTVITWF